MQDTCRIHQDTYCIGTPPNLYRKPHVTPHARQCACLGIGATTARGTGPGRLLVERLNWKAQRLNACHNDAASNVCEDVELRRQHAIPESHAYKGALGQQKEVIVLLSDF
jgi:hypothetical protein